MSSRTYDKEFKLNAVALYKNGKKFNEVCKELGIPGSTFSGWIKQCEKEGESSFIGTGNIKPTNEDLHRTRKELEDVKLERDILKKALAIFSQQK
jgi:transposase-like protein